MRLLCVILPMLLMLGCASPIKGGYRANIKKVLTHYLDKEGRHTLSPSLYERDAYQDYLRKHLEEVAGLRFDILLKAERSPGLTLRVELRGSLDEQPTSATAQSAVFAHGGGRTWESVDLSEEKLRQLGDIVAWRVSLWAGDLLVTEEKSFLW